MALTPNPTADPILRSKLLDFFIATQTSAGLAEWLRDLGVNPAGSINDRRERVRSNTKYLGMPVSEFPRQTRYYLDPFSSDELADLCESIGLSDGGTRDARYRRIMREVRYREGWLPRWTDQSSPAPTADLVAAHLAFFPIIRRGRLEREFCDPIAGELAEVFGERTVHEQLAVAHGNTLKIDFHIGPPQGDGVGVEVKVPANNGDVQRAQGQVDQYVSRYGQALIVLIVPDFISEATLTLFENHLGSKGIRTVIKRIDDA